MAEPRLVILFEDAHILAVSKPAGLLTQPRMRGTVPREPSLEDEVRAYLDPLASGAIYLGTVHRLDRPVSGVIVWAKSPKAARRLAAQFGTRQTGKEYWAVVESAADPGPGVSGTWEDWLSPSSDPSGVVHIQAADTPGARRAVTRWEHPGGSADPGDGLRLLRLRPETGRTHQLRAQAAARGSPILGDTAYGSVRPFGPGIALHARALTFCHPTLGGEQTVVAPWPDSWVARGFCPPEDGGPVSRSC